MLNINKKYIYNSTIKSVFNKIYKFYPDNIFLSSGSTVDNNSIKQYSYKVVKRYINKNISFFRKYNLVAGDRVCVIVGNNPEFFILKLSLNYFGLSCVPINNELSAKEINFILSNAAPTYIIFSINNSKLVKDALSIKSYLNIGLITFNSNNLEILKKSKRKKRTYVKFNSKLESSILYTSGTTGTPKGCVLTHEYEINAGFSYAKKKGLISFKRGKERLYNCLPVHHINSGVFSFFAMLMTANCQIQVERFSLKNFWKDIYLSKATVFHYLGVMVPLLLKAKKNIYEKNKILRLGVGAGIEPSLHYKFEKRFNVLMIELWGMTEMVRCIFDYKKNRNIGKRCFGKVSHNLETKVLNNNGKEVINEKGLFFIRYNNRNPKNGFFSRYNKNAYATKKAWKNGWFNTGDIVIKDHKGYHYFVDREKNIIRRSGENISSTEVEQSLLNLKFIINCAVIPKKHEIYQEEVFAFVIVKKGIKQDLNTAKNILNKIRPSLAYFKLPSFVKFVKYLPLTSSQKTNRSELKKLLLSYKKNQYIDLENFKRAFKKKLIN